MEDNANMDIIFEHDSMKAVTEPINRVTLNEKLRAYKTHPFSTIVLALVILATLVTVGLLGAIIIYILVKGVPNITFELFAWEYTTENVSMMPAIINTLTMIFLTLIMAVPIGVFSAVYLTE